MQNSVYFEKGENDDVAIVLSCPGKEERDAIPPGPAKGQTGKNLEDIFSFLMEQHEIQGFTRGLVTITNAWPEVMFRMISNGKSEPPLSQVLSRNNLDRLHSELKDVKKYIVCCGVNAREAIAQLSTQRKLWHAVKIVEMVHFGNLAMNTAIHKDKNGEIIPVYRRNSEKPPHEIRTIKEIRRTNRLLRLEVVAYRLFEQL